MAEMSQLFVMTVLALDNAAICRVRCLSVQRHGISKQIQLGTYHRRNHREHGSSSGQFGRLMKQRSKTLATDQSPDQKGESTDRSAKGMGARGN
jgi:hypothetical protein